MPVKMRLQRHGKKGRPFYHIVIADGRAPRDGKFIEKIGTYNPVMQPAEIDLNFDKALKWLDNGAQPTDTVRAILSYKGVMYKKHLLIGVKKGAMTLEQAEAKFQAWAIEKEAKINKAKSGYEEKARDDKKAKMSAEAKIKESRQESIAKRKAQAVEAQVSATQAEATENSEADQSAE